MSHKDSIKICDDNKNPASHRLAGKIKGVCVDRSDYNNNFDYMIASTVYSLTDSS